VQGHQKYVWDSVEINQRLRDHLIRAVARVCRASAELGVDWRTAALAVAVERVAEAAERRGIYP
jgi:glutamate dehydrogenase (NAD(P)+)